MRIIHAALQIILFPLPWILRRYLLQFVFGFDIHPGARIGLSVVLSRKLTMREMSRIGNFNLISTIDGVELDIDSGIGTFNYITGYPGQARGHFEHIQNRHCSLILKRGAGLTSRHFVDCTCGVTLGEFTTVAGIGSLLLTHSIDIRLSRQDAAPIVFGRSCFTGAKIVVLPGVTIADRCVISAGTVVYKSIFEGDAVYGSHQLRLLTKLSADQFAYADRDTSNVK